MTFSRDWFEATPREPEPIVAFFTAEEDKQAGESVGFDASLTRDVDGRIEKYAWDFGDGDSDEGKKTRHSYANPGSYVVKLTLSGEGMKTIERAQTISIVE